MDGSIGPEIGEPSLGLRSLVLHCFILAIGSAVCVDLEGMAAVGDDKGV